MASIFGASKGIASCCFACSSKSFSSTNKNSACGSTNLLISQGQATRSTFMFLRVIHFINTSHQIHFGIARPKDAFSEPFRAEQFRLHQLRESPPAQVLSLCATGF